VPAAGVKSDARSSADVATLFEGVVARHGKVDIIVHTPGAVIRKPLADFTDEDFDHVIDLNTRSAFNTLRATARHIADGGRYVVLSTTLTAIMTGPYGLYSGSKAAVERMVLAAAKELGARGVTVNTVARPDRRRSLPGGRNAGVHRGRNAPQPPQPVGSPLRHRPGGRLADRRGGRPGIRPDGTREWRNVLSPNLI
jgi:3-oxoacyl-[acyl-carrier protein] reductase